MGGILKQCIHDGFGLIHFGEKLSGPEYVEQFIEEFKSMQIEAKCLTFVTELKKIGSSVILKAVNRNGIQEYKTKSLVLATGCRERTARQVRIHGTRPAGIFTAGAAQHFVNLQGKMPTRRCVILGSGDIGLIMARRLTLEGADVVGVYEVKPTPSGLTRNIVQCLDDYQIPLHLSHTVTRVFGNQRLTGVEVAKVNAQMKPIEHTRKQVACDALILSVGLIPENEMAEKLDVELDAHTKGPMCNQQFMTKVAGVFSCGNALHVNDLVDYVSESGELAGRAAAEYALAGSEKAPSRSIKIQTDDSLQYLVPQQIDWEENREHATEKFVFYFRSSEVLRRGTIVFESEGKAIFSRNYRNLKPPEMERLELDAELFQGISGGKISVSIRKGEDK